MKCIITTIVFGLSLLLSGAGISYSADFQKGYDAYQKGDYAAALREWSELAEQGHANSQVYLGDMHDKGEGVPQDYKQAVKWYRKAAERGNPKTPFYIGVMFYAGYSVPQDYKEAIKYFRKAAERENTDAQYNLGVMHELGQGVLQNNIYAYMWYDIAASNSHTRAAKNRGKTARYMTASDISKAQELAKECVAKNYKGC
jgi:TPR repeat protein